MCGTEVIQPKLEGMGDNDQAEETPIRDLNKENEKTQCERFADIFKGLLCAFSVSCMLVMSSTFVQLLERRIPDFQLNAVRFASAFVFSSLSVIYTRELPILPRSEILITFCFGFLFFIGPIVYVAATFIPLSSVQAILLTSGIVFIAILYEFFGVEPLTLKTMTCAAICVFGVLLVIQPEFIFQRTAHLSEASSLNNTMAVNSTTRKRTENLANISLGYCSSSIAAIPVPANALLVKKYPYLWENISKVLVWAYLPGAILSSILSVITEKPVLPDNYYEMFMVSGRCFCYLSIWPLTVFSARYISGNSLSVLLSTCVVLMLIPQYTVLARILPGKRNWMKVAGVIIILLGSSLGSIRELCKA